MLAFTARCVIRKAYIPSNKKALCTTVLVNSAWHKMICWNETTSKTQSKKSVPYRLIPQPTDSITDFWSVTQIVAPQTNSLRYVYISLVLVEIKDSVELTAVAFLPLPVSSRKGIFFRRRTAESSLFRATG